jgi:hypothetical protein
MATSSGCFRTGECRPEGEVGVLEIDPLPQERGDRFAAHADFDVLLEAGQIEPGEADRDREDGPV